MPNASPAFFNNLTTNTELRQPQINNQNMPDIGGYFNNLATNTFAPMEELSRNSNANPLDVLGAIGNTALNILDTPFQIAGDGLDYAYDNTIGALTNTQDLFNGDNIRDVLNIGTMLIPGVGLGIKGAKALKNLSNVKKFEKAMPKLYRTTPQQVANSFNAEMIYGSKPFEEALQNAKHVVRGEDLDYSIWKMQDAEKDLKKQIANLADNPLIDRSSPVMRNNNLHFDSNKRENAGTIYDAFDRYDDAVVGLRPSIASIWYGGPKAKYNPFKSPTPLYYVDNTVGFTPDKRAALQAIRGNKYDNNPFRSALYNILGIGENPNIAKIPKGKTVYPGAYRNPRTRNAYREVLIPEYSMTNLENGVKNIANGVKGKSGFTRSTEKNIKSNKKRSDKKREKAQKKRARK